MKRLFLPLAIIACLFLTYGCEVRPFKDFDVAANTFDANVFPLNPKWGKQIEHNTIPNPHDSCPVESDSNNTDDWTKSSQYPSCTSYAVTFNNGNVFCTAPQVSFMPVTYEGIVKWEDHSSAWLDDDYSLNVSRDDNALYNTTREGAIHIEFNSDETVDNWDDTDTWWDKFHHNAVDNGNEQASAKIDGSFVIVIGLLNLDCDHGGLTELHPVYAMFVRIKGNPLMQTSWAFFVRNWGDQGSCGHDQQNLYTRQQKIKVKIPNAISLISNNISDGAQNADRDQLSSMGVTIQLSGDGMLLTFTLLPPEKQSWFVGDLTFATRPPDVNSTEGAGAAAPAVSRNQNIIKDNDRNPDPELEARINRLSKSSKEELSAQLENLVPRKTSVRVRPTLIAEPTKLDETYHKSPVKVITNRDLIRSSKDSAGELKRQKRIEFVRKYLAEKGVE